MIKLLTVAWREYYYNLRRPAFLFAAFGTPIIIAASFFLGGAFGDDNNIEDLAAYGQVGYVDLSEAQVLAPEKKPEDQPDVFVRYEDEAAARAALDEGNLKAFFVLPANYLASGRLNLYSYESVPDNVKDLIDSFLLLNLSDGLETDIPIERVRDTVTDMTVKLADSGRVVDEGGLFFLLMLPMLFAILLMTSSFTTSGFLMSGLVEEKTNRVIEVLVTSVTPMQLLAGKILGLCLLGLTQVLILIISGFVGMVLAQRLDFLTDALIPVDMAILGIIYYLLSYFLLAAFLAGIGAVAGSEQESRQFSAFLTIPFMIPLFFIVNFILDPNGTGPVILSLIPITAPMAMMIRVGVTNVPTWQIIASLGILALTVIVTIWFSARVFRWGLLLYGKRLDLRQLLRVILRREDTQMATTVAHSVNSAADGGA